MILKSFLRSRKIDLLEGDDFGDARRSGEPSIEALAIKGPRPYVDKRWPVGKDPCNLWPRKARFVVSRHLLSLLHFVLRVSSAHRPASFSFRETLCQSVNCPSIHSDAFLEEFTVFKVYSPTHPDIATYWQSCVNN